MFVRLSLVLFFLHSFSVILAQKQATIWYFSNKVGLDFTFGKPKVLSDGAITSFEGCASICDKEGKLLFYTDGITVWNKKHGIMPNGEGLKGHRSSTQSALIIPKPGDGSLYYIFTSDEGGYVNPPNDGIHYSMVSMCLDNGLGDVLVESKNTFIYKPATEKLAAVYHANGTDVWVMTHELYSDKFIAYLVTKEGVSAQPVISAVGFRHPVYLNDDINDSTGEMKFSPDGKRLGVVFYGSGGGQVFDFDAATGKVSNPIRLTNSDRYPGYNLNGANSITFSPNSQVVYMAARSYGLQQYNLLAGGEQAIINSHLLLPTVPSNARGTQLGLDGRLYMIHTGETRYLSVVEKPNELGVACKLNFKGVDFGKNITDFGLCLPNYINNYFSPDPLINYSSACQSNQVTFSFHKAELISSVNWDFGEPASGTSNTSQQLTATHTYSAAGDYQVKVTITLQDGSIKTLHKKVILQTPIEQILGKDTTLCTGDSLVLNLSGLQAACRWQDGFVGSTYTVKQAGTYVVEICKNGCTLIDSINVSYEQKPLIDLGPDKIVCDRNPIKLNAFYGGSTYLWNDGSAAASYQVTQTGTYWVGVTNGCGISYDTVSVLYEESPQVELGEKLTLCVGDTLHLNAYSQVAKSYRWVESSSTAILSNQPTLQVTTNGIYIVEVKGENCLSTDTLEVVFEECPEKVFIPNVITPNGDGKNDRFEIRGIYSGKWSIEIYNRFGKKIYFSSSYTFDWDGTGIDNGAFYYYLYNPESKRKYKGWVQVLR